MEDRKKTDFEFTTNFVTLYSKETNSLEKSIHFSYDKLWKKFLTIAEKSHLCKINQFKSLDKLENTLVLNNHQNKNIKKKIEKLIESFHHVKISQNDKNNKTKIIFRSEQKNQTCYKSNDLTKNVKAKKNLNFVNKTKDNEFKLSFIQPLASSSILVSKTSEKINSSPKAKTNNSTNHFSKNLNNSGKVKQIVEMVEARMKDSSLKTFSIASKLVKSNNQNKPTEKTVHLSSHTFTKKPGVIEKKKIRNSILNQEQKRKSLRKAAAILKDIKRQNEDEKKNTLNEQEIAKNETDQKFKLPTQPLNTRTLKKNNNKVQNIGIKDEPKANITSFNILYNLKNNDKSNFTKFLERNTPIKLSRTGLMAKEKREQERLNEREKLIHEKIEIAKKKREERMKRITDMKLKNEAEIKKRQDEIYAAKMVDSSEHKKKVNDSEKHSTEYDKSKEFVKQAVKLPETMSGIVKNSPFQKFDKQTNKFNKEYKMNNIEQTPKIKNTINRNEMAKPHSNGFNSTKVKKMNILRQISNLGEKKDPVYEDYGIQDLNSSDETDDEEEPNKPIPNWAKDPGFTKMARNQAYKFINFTKLFRSSAQINIDLDKIFEKKRKNFYQRSSSANWNTAPIWNTSGIHGNESFMQTHKN